MRPAEAHDAGGLGSWRPKCAQLITADAYELSWAKSLSSPMGMNKDASDEGCRSHLFRLDIPSQRGLLGKAHHTFRGRRATNVTGAGYGLNL